MCKVIKYVVAFFLFFFINLSWSTSFPVNKYKNWISEMKQSPKGPFISIRWFCNDGEELPPKPYACTKHKGGHQHGKLSERTLILQNKGYKIANLLAGIDADKAIAQDDFIDRYNQLLIEKFLIRADNGWILQKALYYRGAIQEEDEREGGRALLTALAAKPEWIGLRYPALRIGIQLLPHGKDSASVQKVRQMSMSLADQDSRFDKLRVKIHGTPEAGDAKLVREYAAKITDLQRQAVFLNLAEEIDRVYQAPPLSELLEHHVQIFSGGPWLQKLLRDSAKAYNAENSTGNHYSSTSGLLADLRDALPRIHNSSARLRILDLSLAVEAVNFRASTQLRSELQRANRRTRLDWLQNAVLAAYGTGKINQRSSR